MRRLRTLCLAGALIALGAASASAQLRLTVVDSYGTPVPSVRIDVMGQGEVLAVHSTSADGVADLDDERWSEVRRLTFSHLGFRTLIVQAGDVPADGMIALEPEAVAIDGLDVEGRELCPIVPSEEARDLWARTAARYSPDTENRALSAFLERGGGRVPETELYRPAASDGNPFLVAWAGGVWHGDDWSPKPLSQRALAEGYAWEPIEIGGIRDPGEWNYADLHSSGAHHFASRAFGALHDFAIDGEAGGVTTLAFCPIEREGVTNLRGVIQLNEDRGFLRADWRFSTPERDEGAGGFAQLYAHPEARDVLPHLMASSGTFFRHNGRPPLYPTIPRDYVLQSIDVSGWTVHPDWYHPCGEQPENDDPASRTGGGRYNVYSLRQLTPYTASFLACVEENWGLGPR